MPNKATKIAWINSIQTLKIQTSGNNVADSIYESI